MWKILYNQINYAWEERVCVVKTIMPEINIFYRQQKGQFNDDLDCLICMYIFNKSKTHNQRSLQHLILKQPFLNVLQTRNLRQTNMNALSTIINCLTNVKCKQEQADFKYQIKLINDGWYRRPLVSRCYFFSITFYFK